MKKNINEYIMYLKNAKIFKFFTELPFFIIVIYFVLNYEFFYIWEIIFYIIISGIFFKSFSLLIFNLILQLDDKDFRNKKIDKYEKFINLKEKEILNNKK